MSKTVLGVEFGSTRIKAVLIDEKGKVLATGGYEWENELVDGLWSYTMENAWAGLRAAVGDLLENYARPLDGLSAIGISGMMHGYLAFDSGDRQLAPFRTWRNTNTGAAAAELSSLFHFNIPMRWSVAQYEQAILNGEAHVENVSFLTTLSGYVHYHLTGKKVIGIGEASGMFPVKNGDYDPAMLATYDKLLASRGLRHSFRDLLPKVLLAGEDAGTLTEEGAKRLDPLGRIPAGIPLCPPEGDMSTGMMATNSILPKTANASLGTSANLTVILEKPLKEYHPEIDVIATPEGFPAALLHTNNCTSEINAWAGLFEELLSLFGCAPDKGELFTKLFRQTEESGKTLGLTAYNFVSGDAIVQLESGKPLLLRELGGKLTLADFMQAQIWSSVAVMAVGMETLRKEGVTLELVNGHGGFFKTPVIGQKALSAAVGAPVAVQDNAGEGGAWGIALLALYLGNKEKTLGAFLAECFASASHSVVEAEEDERRRFAAFLADYRKYLPAVRAASQE